MRLADLRDALGVDLKVRRISEEDLDKALRTERFISLPELIANPDFMSDGANAVYRYAQAWGFVHYLNRTHRKSFAGYLTALAKREPGEAIEAKERIRLFEAHFGPLDRAMLRDFVGLMLKLHLDRREAGR